MKEVYFDIETVAEYNSLEEAPEQFQEAWEYVMDFRYPEDERTNEFFLKKAGLHPEFSKIVCVSIYDSETKSLHSHTDQAGEEVLLKDLFKYLNEQDWDNTRLIGHNIHRFDIPALISRGMKHRLGLPSCLVANGKKPWELDHIIDTLKVYKNNQFNTTQVSSLVSITALLGVPSPKDELQGGGVGDLYRSDDPQRLEKISAYCEGDVKATARVFKVFKDCGLISY